MGQSFIGGIDAFPILRIKNLNQAIKLVKDSNDAACCVGYVSFVEIIYWGFAP